MDGNALGIDFGTSFCTMCRCNPETGKPEVIRDECGLDKIPSVVYWGPGGDVRVGDAAVAVLQASFAMEPEKGREARARVIASVKRRFYPDRMIALPGGETVAPVDVAAAILKYLKRNAEERCFHGPARSATLTHPASFTKAQKTLLEEAGKKAGFEVVLLLEEPVAAAMGYVASGAKVGKGILVYDFGGGTLDLAFVTRDGAGGFRVPVAPCGDASCGGDDFDRALYDYAEADLLKTQGVRFSDENVDLSFLLACRQVKERLSHAESGVVRHFPEGRNAAYTLSVDRKTFDGLIASKVAHTAELAEELLRRVRAAKFEVDTVVLIGGSSRIPLVREALGRAIRPHKPLATMHDDCAVAMGAATYNGSEPEPELNADIIIETVELPGGVPLELVWCPAGTFWMGSPEGEDGRSEDEPRHQVTLTRGFWLGRHPVTQEQWEAVMHSNPGSFKGGHRSVDNVSWDNCQSFIEKVNDEVLGGEFSLPTEAEWEYACRAGRSSGVRQEQEKRANEWGLNAMLAGGYEWCSDKYGGYPVCTVINPHGASSGSGRVFRGGKRCAKRFSMSPSEKKRNLGFRIARLEGTLRERLTRQLDLYASTLHAKTDKIVNSLTIETFLKQVKYNVPCRAETNWEKLRQDFQDNILTEIHKFTKAIMGDLYRPLPKITIQWVLYAFQQEEIRFNELEKWLKSNLHIICLEGDSITSEVSFKKGREFAWSIYVIHTIMFLLSAFACDGRDVGDIGVFAMVYLFVGMFVVGGGWIWLLVNFPSSCTVRIHHNVSLEAMKAVLKSDVCAFLNRCHVKLKDKAEKHLNQIELSNKTESVKEVNFERSELWT